MSENNFNNVRGITAEKIRGSMNFLEVYKKSLALILDIDETLFKSVHKHYKVWQELAKKYDLPEMSYAEFCANGGSFAYRDACVKRGIDFNELNLANVNDPEFNQNMELVKGAREAMLTLSPLVLCYLTARPGNVKEISEKEIQKAGLPDVKIIFAPDDGHVENASLFKIEELKKIKDQNPDKKIVLIDDSISIYKAIKQLNDPRVDVILFNGDLTDTEKYQQAMNWLQIVESLSINIQSLVSKNLFQSLN